MLLRRNEVQPPREPSGFEFVRVLHQTNDNALDSVDIKGYQTLLASVVLLVLRDMIPRKIKVVILADRAFGRTLD